MADHERVVEAFRVLLQLPNFGRRCAAADARAEELSLDELVAGQEAAHALSLRFGAEIAARRHGGVHG